MKEILIVLTFLGVINCGQKTKRETIVVQGEKGEKGDPGTKGDAGPTGSPGAVGEKGERGEMGLSGRDGMQGPTGETGPSGRDGTNGRDGMNGTNGRDGTDGRDGHDGDTIVWPKPQYSRYCYSYYDVNYIDESCGENKIARYHIYYQVHTMPNTDVFAQLCEGYNATGSSCNNALRTAATYDLGDPNYATASLSSKFLKVKLTAPLAAEVKGNNFLKNVVCKELGW